MEDLLLKTLHSLSAQTVRADIIVVTNRELPEANTIPGLRQLVVDFPAPSTKNCVRTERDAVLLDKGAKLALGTSHVRDGYIMFVDADDFVHDRLAAWIEENKGPAGWFVGRGWSYNAQTGVAVPVNDFNQVCGSSLVIKRDLLTVPSLQSAVTREGVVASLGWDLLVRQYGSHHYLAADFGLAVLPFRAAVYSVSTGENHSGARLRARGRPASTRLRSVFHLPGPTITSAWIGYLRLLAEKGGSRLRRMAIKALP